jgi:hypothetical protein
MVANVTRMISMVDNEVDDAIWVIRKLLQGVVKFVVIRTPLGVECIEVVNLPLALVNKNMSMELPFTHHTLYWVKEVKVQLRTN